MKTALVCGAGGFIGGHLVHRLKKEGYWVRGVDLKPNEFSPTSADDFVIGDLRDQALYEQIFDTPFDEVYQLAAEMGGAGYLFTGENDADVMHNSASININVLSACHTRSAKRVFYSSSACIYPQYNQEDPSNPICTESSAYPADPDSEYGWESCSVSASISLIGATMACKLTLRAITIFSGQKARMMAAKRKCRQPCAAKSRWLKMETVLKFGGMVSKPVRSYISTIVSTRPQA